MSTEHTPGRQNASEMQEPLSDDKWMVHWWNESMRLMLPADRCLARVNVYSSGTIQLTIRPLAAIAKAEGGEA